MMNEIIKEQLKKVKIAAIPAYSESDGEIIIPKSTGRNLNPDLLQVGHYYRIIVAEYIVKPFEGFTLHDNWNQGRIPTDRQMSVEILQLMGKRVYISALGIYDRTQWTGWLPIKSVLKFEEIE